MHPEPVEGSYVLIDFVFAVARPERSRRMHPEPVEGSYVLIDFVLLFAVAVQLRSVVASPAPQHPERSRDPRAILSVSKDPMFDLGPQRGDAEAEGSCVLLLCFG